MSAFPGVKSSAMTRDKRGTTLDLNSLEPQAWDAAVQLLGGSLKQSWGWGELERRYNRVAVERIRVTVDGGEGVAQLLLRKRGPIVTASMFDGPLISDDRVSTPLFEAIDRVCISHRALRLRIEPRSPLPERRIAGRPFVHPSRPRPTTRTLVIPLLDDEALLSQMRKQTRRYVRLGERRGVIVQVVERPAADAPEIEIFNQLLTETAERNAFRIRPLAYYADALRVLGDDAALLVAWSDGVPAAVEVVVRYGTLAGSLWAASSTTHREYGIAAYLLFESMRWARDRGSTHYDLWGLPPDDPDPAPVDGVSASHGRQQDGLYRFKIGFGGSIVDFPPAVERHYWPRLMRFIRFLQRRGLILPRR